MTRTAPKGVLVLAVAGALLVLLGTVVLLSRFSTFPPGEFGWFAYAPSGVAGDAPMFYVVTLRDLWGFAAATLGVACLACGGGYLLGVRRTSGGPGGGSSAVTPS